MKVLVITPIYYIEGRDNLFHDTSAIHYLLKYWPKDVEIVVIHEYHSSIKQFYRYTRNQERKYLKYGYHFKKDGIKVNMYELPIIPKQKILLKPQKKYMINRINKTLEDNLFKPDIIICHQPSYYSSQFIESINTNAKRIAVLHYSDVKEQQRNSNFIKSLSLKFDAVYCRSKNIYNFFKNENLDNLNDECIYSGVPKIMTKVEKHWDSDFLRILYAGKLIKRKNVDMVIRALSKLEVAKKFELVIVGKGPEKKNLVKLCKELSLLDKVKFVPHISREEVYSYMSKSDIFVMPSIGETLGLVYLEAMQQGCIPIGTKGEGIDGIIKSGINGFLVDANNIESLVNILKDIFNASINSNMKISNEALKTAQLFEEEKMSMHYYNIIKEFIRDNSLIKSRGRLDRCSTVEK